MSDQNSFEERVVSAVLSFINAETWAESKTIVQAYQDDLLTPAADQVIEGLLMHWSVMSSRNLLKSLTLKNGA